MDCLQGTPHPKESASQDVLQTRQLSLTRQHPIYHSVTFNFDFIGRAIEGLEESGQFDDVIF